MSLEGRTALVTGGSNGIGEAIGERFLEEGAEAAVMVAASNSFNGAEIEVGGEAHNNQYGL